MSNDGLISEPILLASLKPVAGGLVKNNVDWNKVVSMLDIPSYKKDATMERVNCVIVCLYSENGWIKDLLLLSKAYADHERDHG